MGYCTPEDIQHRIRSDFSDRDLEAAIEAATTRIEEECHRVFVAEETESRTFEAVRAGFCVIDDLLMVGSVYWAGAAITPDGYKFKPGGTRTPKWAITGPWYEGDAVTVTGLWGYTATCPADIRDACIEWVVRAIKRADAGYGDVSAVPELGQLIYQKAVPASIRRVLDRYRRVIA